MKMKSLTPTSQEKPPEEKQISEEEQRAVALKYALKWKVKKTLDFQFLNVCWQSLEKSTRERIRKPAR